jgi:hypothetical protein
MRNGKSRAELNTKTPFHESCVDRGHLLGGE